MNITTGPEVLDGIWSSLEKLQPACPSNEECSHDCFSTEAFVNSVARRDLDDLTPAVLRILDRLCGKIEVAQRLLAGYTGSLDRSTTDIAASATCLARLFYIYLYTSVAHSDPKFLNTALKIAGDTVQNPALETPLLDDALALAVHLVLDRQPLTQSP